MTALAFLLASGWRPERNDSRPDWRLWIAIVMFYGLALVLLIQE